MGAKKNLKNNGKPNSPEHPGSCFRRKDGSKAWQAQITIDGKRRNKSFPTRKEAIAWLWEMDEQRHAAAKSGNVSLNLKTFLSEWIERRNPLAELDKSSGFKKSIDQTLGMKPWRSTTYLTNLSIMKNHILPRIHDENLLITEVDHLWVVHFFAKALDDNVGGRIRQIMLNLMHQAFSNALSKGLIRNNPVRDIHIAEYTPKKGVALERDVLHEIVDIAVAHNAWFKNIIPFSVASQLRRSEALGLRWENVDWENRTITVVEQLQRLPIKGKEKRETTKSRPGLAGSKHGSSLTLSPLKTTSSLREVRLGEKSMEILRDQFEMIEKMKATSGIEWRDEGWIFPNQSGGAYDGSNLSRDFKKLLRKAGVDINIRFHDLRHTGVSYVRSAKVGGTLEEAGKRAGQANEKTVERYTHELTEDRKALQERLDDFLYGEGE